MQPSSVLLKAWLLIGQWRVDKLQWRAYVLLMDERYCSMHPKFLDSWTLRNEQCSLLWVTLESSSFTVLISKKRKVMCNTVTSTRTEAAAERFNANAALPQLEASVGRRQLAPRNTDPSIDQRLSPFVSGPSSQVLCSIVTWKNVGCRCLLSDQHADEETFYLRARGMTISAVTYVHTHVHVGAVLL